MRDKTTELREREDQHALYLQADEEDDNYQILTDFERRQLREQELKLQEDTIATEELIALLGSKKQHEVLDDLHDFLELRDPKAYRARMKGYGIAFNIRGSPPKSVE